MKLKAKENKLHRINPNSVLCSQKDFHDLKDGKIVELADKSAKQLLNMGVVEQIKKQTKKESK